MTIGTYSELKDAISNWSARADLASGGANINRVDEILDNAEAMLNRDFRALQQETKNAAYSITGEYVAVPTDFLEVRSFELEVTPRVALTYMPDDTQVACYGTGSGEPKFFTVAGTNFRFAPVPDGTYTATLCYYAKIPALNGTNTTNWFLTAHPDIYLAACQMWTAIFLRDAEGVANWKMAYESLRDGLLRADKRSRWGGNGMMVRVA
jgi:hypothetical protein